MKQLLRGIIDFGSLSREGMEINFQRLADSRIEWDQPEDERIFRFVSEFFQDRLELPSGKLMSEYFSRDENIEVVERLKDLEAATPHEGANFKFVLDGALEDQARRALQLHLKNAQVISGKGLTIKEGRNERRLQGLSDAVSYLDDADLHALNTSKVRPLVRTDLKESTYEAWAEYLEAKANPASAFGVLSGFEPIDVVCHGLKPGEMWIHAAYTGEMKSTLAQNVAYSAMTRYRRNVVYVSLEMTLRQFRRSIHVMHASHPKFRSLPSIDYRNVRDADLSAEAEEAYKQVLDDFRQDPEHCGFETITVNERLSIKALRTELERIGREMEIGLVVIDHSELLEPPEKSRDHGTAINSIYHGLRDISLQFGGGKGLPLMVLHQVNRQGKDRADKEGGEYSSMSALSWAHEAERSASLITWSYLDKQLRERAEVRVGCLKNRDNPHFDRFELSVSWGTKRLSCPSAETSEEARRMTEDFSSVNLDQV